MKSSTTLCNCRQPGLGGDCDGSCQHPKPRYEVRTDGYWSFIIDTATGRTHSHGYDLVCDADLEAERLNEEESSDGKP